MPTDEDYVAAALRTAAEFGLTATAAQVLSHSENVVCELRLDDDTRKVMRLHRPGYNSAAELESEVRWVKALGEAGLPVPTAVPTLAGGHYTNVSIGDEQRQVGVVEWVHGAPLGGPVDVGTESLAPQYRRIGELTAQIRAHNATWTPPADFVRRRWDTDAFLGAAPLWGRFWDVERLSPGQRSLFNAARTRLTDEFSSLPTTPDAFGLIHADLHLGNVMEHDGALTMIDFDDAGYGWFSHELAVALHPVLDEPWYPEALAEILAGYRSVHPFSDHEEALIESFQAMRWLMIIGWLDARPELPVAERFTELLGEAEAAISAFMSR